jgi:hypothetical protein
VKICNNKNVKFVKILNYKIVKFVKGVADYAF